MLCYTTECFDMARRESSKLHKRSKKIMAADAHVGARVRSRRLQLGMSQSDLGEVLGWPAPGLADTDLSEPGSALELHRA